MLRKIKGVQRLIEKSDVLNMLNYRLSRKDKQMNESSNAEEVKKLQYQKEEVLVIIEKVQGM